MSRRSTIWLVIAVLFLLLNAAGAAWAALQGELIHTVVHAVLTVLSVYAVRRILAPRAAGY